MSLWDPLIHYAEPPSTGPRCWSVPSSRPMATGQMVASGAASSMETTNSGKAGPRCRQQAVSRHAVCCSMARRFLHRVWWARTPPGSVTGRSPSSFMKTLPPSMAGINDGFSGGAPDLGAIESGCDEPHYGLRPAHEQDRVWPIDCRPSPSPTGIHDPMTRPQEPPFRSPTFQCAQPLQSTDADSVRTATFRCGETDHSRHARASRADPCVWNPRGR